MRWRGGVAHEALGDGYRPNTVNNVRSANVKPTRKVTIETKVRKQSPYVWLTDSYRAIARSLEDECRG